MSTTTTTDTITYVREEDWHDGLTRQVAAELSVPEWEVERAYDDMLAEVYGPIRVVGLEYDAATVLRQVDPIAYRVGLSDYSAQEFREVYLPDLPDGCCTCAASLLGNSWHTRGCSMYDAEGVA